MMYARGRFSGGCALRYTTHRLIGPQYAARVCEKSYQDEENLCCGLFLVCLKILPVIPPGDKIGIKNGAGEARRRGIEWYVAASARVHFYMQPCTLIRAHRFLAKSQLCTRQNLFTMTKKT